MPEKIDKIYKKLHMLTGVPMTRDNVILLADIFITLEDMAKMTSQDEVKPEATQDDGK